MAIKVILSVNSTASTTPNSSVVAAAEVGELFVNSANGYMWVKHSNGSIVPIHKVGPPGAPGTPPSDGADADGDGGADADGL
jgi:hypothetical protein